MGFKAVRFFSQQFQAENMDADRSSINHIPKLIIETENENMVILPEEDEVKHAVFLSN